MIPRCSAAGRFIYGKFLLKIEHENHLQLVYRLCKIKGRTNISPDEEFLQLASIRMKNGKTFNAHKHVIVRELTKIVQESWLVINGSVTCIFYDLEDPI